jgi:signal transduction histidine kinase
VRESGEKDVLLKKFAELNATAQLGVLAHRIAHDLRGPLGSISGYIQIESAKPCSEEQTQTLRDLEDVVNNMSGSLRNITRFGRADAVNREKIDLSAFMDSLLAIISFYPQSGGVAFRRSYPRGGLAVFASRADLQQAYFNILKNAVEAVRNNPGEKEVEVSVRPTSAGLEVAIADNGPGILPEIAASLFKKSVSTKKDGTGVGLMITRDLLQRNDASIELRERNGGGTAAVTLIPAA